MMEMCRSVMNGFASYILQNHMLVLALGTILLLLVVREKKSGGRLAIYSLVMCLVLWIPVTGAILMKMQTSFYGYESLWSSLVPVPVLIALGGVLLLQREENGVALQKPAQEEKKSEKEKADQVQKKKEIRLAVGSVAVFLLIFLLGNMGRIQTVSVAEVEMIDNTELKQLVTSIHLEQLKGDEQGLDRVWAPREVIVKAKEYSGDITLLYGRDLWEAEAAAYSYDAYEADSVALFEFMESLKEEDPYAAIEDVELKESAMNDRGLRDGMVMAYAKMMGAGLWVMPRSAETRMNYALEALEEEYGYRVDVASSTSNYIVYRIEE